MKPIDELPYLEYEEDSGELKRVYADSWVSEEVTLPAIVTKNSVESGVKITDHYRPDTRTVHVELFFSGSPVRGDLDPDNPGEVREVSLDIPEYPSNDTLVGARARFNDFAGNGQALPRTVSMLQFRQDPAIRMRTVLQLIDRWQSEGTLITCGGTMLRFESMAIEEARGKRDAGSGDGASITLQLTKIEYASTDVAVAVAVPTAAQPKTQANAGAPTEVDEVDSSVLKALGKKIRGVLGLSP